MQIDNLRVRAASFDAEHSTGEIGEKQSLIVDALPIVFYTAAPKGLFSGPRFLSESIAGAIGYTADAFVKDPDLWATRIHPDDRKRLQDHLQRIYDTGSISIEYRWRCADGSERVFLDQGVLARDPSGAPQEVLGTCLDITDRLELERQINRSEKAAASDNFARGFVHDFNNILSAIIWNIDLLGRSSKKDDANIEFIENAMGSALNGIELLRQLAVDRSSQIEPADTKKQITDKDIPAGKAAGDIVILAVEDDDSLRQTIAVQIKKMGHRVLEASNAATALDILRGDQIVDLLFTDVVMMGGMDGFTLARRAVDLRPELKVLITSGYLPAVDRIANLSKAFLSKPYSGEELRQALASALLEAPS